MLLTEKGLPSFPLSLFSSCPCHCLSSCGLPFGLVKQWQGQICEPGKRTKNGPEQCKCFTYRLATEWGAGEAKELAWSVNTNINQCPNFPAFTGPPPIPSVHTNRHTQKVTRSRCCLSLSSGLFALLRLRAGVDFVGASLATASAGSVWPELCSVSQSILTSENEYCLLGLATLRCASTHHLLGLHLSYLNAHTHANTQNLYRIFSRLELSTNWLFGYPVSQQERVQGQGYLIIEKLETIHSLLHFSQSSNEYS